MQELNNIYAYWQSVSDAERIGGSIHIITYILTDSIIAAIVGYSEKNEKKREKSGRFCPTMI